MARVTEAARLHEVKSKIFAVIMVPTLPMPVGRRFGILGDMRRFLGIAGKGVAAPCEGVGVDVYAPERNVRQSLGMYLQWLREGQIKKAATVSISVLPCLAVPSYSQAFLRPSSGSNFIGLVR